MSIEQDNKIITEIWHKHKAKISALCKYKLQSCPEEAEDVASAVFAALVEESRKRKIPDRVEPWLYKVAQNLINKKYAEMRKHKDTVINVDFDNIDKNEELELKLQVNPDFNDELIDDADIEILKEKLLSELSEDELQLIELVCAKKMKLKDVATVMDSTPTAVKQKFYRTKRKVIELSKDKIEKFL